MPVVTRIAPFKQVDAKSDGLGLGLSLVKNAAGYLNYKIGVSSSVGIGSRFSFVIPAAMCHEDLAHSE